MIEQKLLVWSKGSMAGNKIGKLQAMASRTIGQIGIETEIAHRARHRTATKPEIAFDSNRRRTFGFNNGAEIEPEKFGREWKRSAVGGDFSFGNASK